MEECLIYWNASPCGTVRLEEQGLYTKIAACCGARRDCLFSLILEGERGSLTLGVPEWSDGCYVLRRTIVTKECRQIGKVCCAYLTERSTQAEAQEREQGWMRLKKPEYFFHSLTPQLAGNDACYWKQAANGRWLAVPIDDGRPFLLPRYFCFAKVQRLWGKSYAVFFFDSEDQPQNF